MRGGYVRGDRVSLQIHHDAATGSSTLKWRVYRPTPRDVLLGFLRPKSRSAYVFKAAHPALDKIDGAQWGENVRGMIVETMKGAL